MRKITKFLMAGLMLLTCAVGLSNTRGEVKEAEAATFGKADDTGTWTVVGSFNDWNWEDETHDMVYNEETDRFEFTMELAVGDLFKIGYNHSNAITIQYDGHTGDGIGTYLKKEVEHNYFEVVVAGTYTLFVKDDNVSNYGSKSYGFGLFPYVELEPTNIISSGTSLYFAPNSNWTQANAWFAAKFGDSLTSEPKFIKMLDINNDGIYEVTAPEGEFRTIIFLRKDPANSDLDGVCWNITNKQCYDGTNNLFTLESDSWNFSDGLWSVYHYTPTNLEVIASSIENDEEAEIKNAVKFVSALPKGTEAKVNSENDEYNVGLKFEFERTWTVEETLPDTEKDISSNYIILKPNSNWTQSNAWFAVYHWGTSGSSWTKMLKGTIPNCSNDENSYYYIEKSALNGHTNVIFCRMNPDKTALDWGSKWDQTVDLTIQSGKNTCSINSGQWNNAAVTWSNTSLKQTVPGGVQDVQHSQEYIGYYTCSNISAIPNVEFEFSYEVETYFAVTVTDIPFEGYENEVLTVSVTAAYQSHDGTTIYGNTAYSWVLTETESGIALSKK